MNFKEKDSISFFVYYYKSVVADKSARNNFEIETSADREKDKSWTKETKGNEAYYLPSTERRILINGASFHRLCSPMAMLRIHNERNILKWPSQLESPIERGGGKGHCPRR